MRRTALTVRDDAVEDVLDVLLPRLPQGVHPAPVGDGAVELAIFGDDLPTEDELAVAAGDAPIVMVAEEAPDDRTERRRRYSRGVVIADRLVLRPSDAPPGPAGLPEVIVDSPAGAFGTGAHPTTRMCLELLLELDLELEPAAGAVVDLGCGSGVLAIAAAKLGFGPVLGVDHDPLAIEATTANARVNGAEVDARRYDLMRDGTAQGAPIVLANLLGPLLRRLAEVGFDEDEPRAALIASGLLVSEADDIAAVFARRELAERSRRTDGEWAALLFAAPRS
jgi:ribosomal protein L11 methyltransferase